MDLYKLDREWACRKLEKELRSVWLVGNDTENRTGPSRPTWCHASAESATHARELRVETHLPGVVVGHVRCKIMVCIVARINEKIRGPS